MLEYYANNGDIFYRKKFMEWLMRN